MMGGTVIALHRRPPLLVAEDDRQDVQREARRASRCALVFIGFNVTFFTQFILGSRGMPRRYYNYLDQFQPLHAFSTVRLVGPRRGLVPDGGLSSGRRCARRTTPRQPVGRPTLEWQTQSPPIEHNFDDDPGH